MKKLFYLLTLIILFTLTSCKDPNPVPTPTNIVYYLTKDGVPFEQPAEFNILQDETALFQVHLKDSSIKCDVKWYVDGKLVYLQNNFVYTASEIGTQKLHMQIIASDGTVPVSSLNTINIISRYAQGTFVLNEGNFSNDNGSLIFISDKGKIFEKVYNTVNNSYLGNALQDMFISDKSVYFISQNGNIAGGDGKLIIADAETLKRKTVYNEALKSLSWPTNIAVLGSDIYIRDGRGVHLFNPSTDVLTLIEGAKGAAQGRMAVAEGRVFVPAGRNIYAIKGQVVDTIKFTGAVSGIIKSNDGNLWVSCTTNPATISKVNPKDLSVIKTNDLGQFAVGAGWSGSPAISAVGDTLYFSNATTKINRHIFGSNKTEAVVDVATLVDDANMVYGNLGVNPRTGLVFFTTIKGYGQDYLTNNITIIDASKSEAKLVENYKGYTRFPAGTYFTGNF